ncbi:hypothetical protein VIBNISFn27_p10101 [Vibrio nigripulchritudo SFn27]|uniref:Coenzyme PQQ synthesis protein D (PqqD) n=1 Tax=Vibrio nigripulchritudo TaxID=28173 RepID=A0A9P1JLI7_9VIBR|nr:PqqD family protein [Vibrio nigripulchritudo]CBJ93131.1 Conserved hypothetical protein [Vibrio nigripulchritudo]CCN85946.1 hypothetical protein VIBNIBLFn1_p0092 [Vibrio nigripulchritudo BLFn1]CCN91943.1 hypothetical protein VIBNISFn27_p10101 [Vibrio nigripulchritudo SFn27]CCN97743.1 hypothetical protein VIBNIENn2_p0091 [Vibrio nigripulchritudo ENn2]CCO43977.1 hypothetical protein VIBNISFn135_p10101 [Vibrio nigripulchritudo SFn135]
MEVNILYKLRNIGNSTYIVGPGDAIEINNTGRIIWSGIEDGQNEDDIVTSILAEYDVDREIATNDVKEFIRFLTSNELVTE